jgi:hypothetical protein
LLRGTPGIVRWNLGLTVLALLLLGSSLAFRLQGGAENPSLDAAQLLVIWGYVLLTPVLCALAWRARKTHGQSSRTNLLLFGLWLLAMVGGAFLHL